MPTDREVVLEKYRDAFCYEWGGPHQLEPGWSVRVKTWPKLPNNEQPYLGGGDTHDEAWADAASRIRRGENAD